MRELAALVLAPLVLLAVLFLAHVPSRGASPGAPAERAADLPCAVLMPCMLAVPTPGASPLLLVVDASVFTPAYRGAEPRYQS